MNKGRGRSNPTKGKQRPSQPIRHDGHDFDSLTEARFYQKLKRDPMIESIEVHPVYKVIDQYKVTCKRCKGSGQWLNPTTMRLNKCTRCQGGKMTKAGNRYTADFKVTHVDGYVEVFDVKGGPVERDFPVKKSLFEAMTGIELIVVRWEDKTNQWSYN